NVKEKGLFSESAIIIEVGDGREDRLMSGSYIELRNAAHQEDRTGPAVSAGGEYFVPDASSSNAPSDTIND
ncbi:MAG: hypothetical protein GY826_35360, partial [Fuerstiella sp.]|nr:hypothetical protein [Fuerstiella sp.]